jgi:hypothetical protein
MLKRLIQDGSDFKGQRLTVQFARGARPRDAFAPPDRVHPRPRRTAYRMQLTGLAEGTSWQVSYNISDFLPGWGDFGRGWPIAMLIFQDQNPIQGLPTKDSTHGVWTVAYIGTRISRTLPAVLAWMLSTPKLGANVTAKGTRAAQSITGLS